MGSSIAIPATRNSDYLLENAAAIKINNRGDSSAEAIAMLNDPGRLKSLKENAKRIAHPNAAFDVAKLALQRGSGRG